MVNLIPTHGSRAKAPTHEPKRQYGKSDPRSARPWRRLREEVLKRDRYTCKGKAPDGQECGLVDIHMEVDHIIPRSRGGQDELKNLQTLCELCHLMKTSAEASTKGASMCPEWMPRAVKPLTLVCGRPGAGKKDLVKQRAGRNDLVVDLDQLAARMRRQIHQLTKQQMHALIRYRNNRIAEFCRGDTEHPACWIVTTAGRIFQRDFWKERGAEILVVTTPLEICQRRIAAMDHPPAHIQNLLQAAAEWQE